MTYSISFFLLPSEMQQYLLGLDRVQAERALSTLIFEGIHRILLFLTAPGTSRRCCTTRVGDYLVPFLGIMWKGKEGLMAEGLLISFTGNGPIKWWRVYGIQRRAEYSLWTITLTDQVGSLVAEFLCLFPEQWLVSWVHSRSRQTSCQTSWQRRMRSCTEGEPKSTSWTENKGGRWLSKASNEISLLLSWRDCWGHSPCRAHTGSGKIFRARLHIVIPLTDPGWPARLDH